MYRFAGKARRMTLNTYPETSLADAKVEHAEAKRDLATGIDPGAEAVQTRLAERQAETIAELVNEYLEKWARPRKRSAAEDERLLKKDVLPYWSSWKVKTVARRDVIVLIDRVVARGAPVMANRLLSTLKKMFRFAVSRGILDINPCAEIEPPAKRSSRDRILSETEIATFWHSLDKTGMSDQARLALKFQLVTAQRRSEVTQADWSEFDLDKAVWTIAGHRSKNGVSHIVPLSPMAIELLEQIKAVSDESPWLFPSPRAPDKPICKTTVNRAIDSSRDTMGVVDFTPHDLRRSAASHMTASGITRLVVGKVLNHTDRGVTAIYDRHSYYAEKCHALNTWAQRLEEIISGRATEKTSNVTRLSHG